MKAIAGKSWTTPKKDEMADIYIIRAMTFAELIEEAKAARSAPPRKPKWQYERRMNLLKSGEMSKFLTPQRVALLELLAERGGIAITELSKTLNRAKTAVARDVASLEQGELVKTELVVNPGHGRVTMVTPLARRYEFVWSIGAPARKIAAKSSAKKGKRKAA